MPIYVQDVAGTGEWPSILADYIRKNDEALMKTTSTLLNVYQQKFIRATKIVDFLEFLRKYPTNSILTSFKLSEK